MAIIGYIVEIGLDAVKDKIVDEVEQQKIKCQLKSYIERQENINISCSLEEEIDFSGLASYIQTDLLEDIKICLFGKQKERESARETIINKAVTYSKAKTSLSRKRTIGLTKAAIDILQNFYRSNIDPSLFFIAAQIEDTITDTTKQLMQQSVKQILESTTENEQSLPHVLTKSPVSFADEKIVIHREHDLRNIKDLLAGKKVALLLSGFGGIGKTALIHVLYTKFVDQVEHIGWVEYHGNLKDSLLASLDLNDEIIDVEKRWKTISKRLRNNQAYKVIFIDNVDRDNKQQQDPESDLLLQEITGWPNMTVVLTSRMAELRGYQTYKIESLGSKECIEPCVDLFYFYYDQDEFQKRAEERRQHDAVIKLVERAGFHTFAIELLARSAKYEDDLFIYLKEIERSGFQFPNLLITTGHSGNYATTAEQLRLLFNMRSRSDKERQILWDFSILPEGTSLSRNEVGELLAYTENDLHRLCQDGWLRYERGQGFNIHPLVKEVVHFNLNNGKAPRGTAYRLIALVQSNTLISRQDTQSAILRKLYLMENANNYISFENDLNTALFYYRMGLMEFQFARKRLTSISYLEEALQRYQALYKTGGSNLADIAKAQYQLGYVKSTTHQYRGAAKADLQSALDIWESLEGVEHSVAMAHDHLGYVLSDSAETYDCAKAHLTKALHMRESFVKSDPSPDNLSAYATTCDNLGCLLMKSNDDTKEAECRLKEALSIREDLYENSDRYATDVAWTSFNLGQLMSRTPPSRREAEAHFRRSLAIRRELERLHPQMYTTNIVFTLVALSKLISLDAHRLDEAEQLLNEAIHLKSDIDLEHTGFFTEEIEETINTLSALLEQRNQLQIN